MTSSTSSIKQYYSYLLEHPKRAPKKLLTTYKKLCDDIDNGKTIEYINQGGELERTRFVFDKDKAQRPIYFIEHFCRHSKGKWAGKPIILELWQKALIEAVYGFVNEENGLRKYKKVVFFVAKKNGKSTISSGLGLYGLTSDNEGGAEIYSVAKVRDQAKIVWDEACHMRASSKALRDRTRKTISGIYYDAKASKFEALASQKNTLDGKNPFYVLMDEVWTWEDLGLLSIMEDGVSAREQPLIIETSTMGQVRGKVFDHEYEYCERVIKGYQGQEGGIQDETILPIIYELDDANEIWDQECWYKANPNLGISKGFDYLREKVQKAKDSPIDLSNILCKDFNVRQTSTHAWLTYEELNNEAVIEDWRDAYCIGGVDLSSVGDLTACTLLGRKNGKMIVKQMYFLPEANLAEKSQADKIPYDLWKKLGYLRTCEGSKVNYSDAVKWFIEQVEEYGLRPLWVGYDSWSASYFCDEMKQNGFDMVSVIQGAKTMSTPMKQLKADLKDKKVIYNNNPILKWCLSNLAIKSDENENIRPVKEHQTQRIDGAVSLIDAYVIYYEHMQEFINFTEEG